MELHEAEGKLLPRLADGSSPVTAQGLLERLAALGIVQRTVSHPPLFTVAESKELRGQLSGLHIKNLFLRNKKGAMWLVTCLEDRAVDLKWLGEVLEAGRFSFGSAERLMAYLGVSPGAVTPFAVINDRGGDVAMVLDRALVGPELVNAHPLVNDRTTAVSGDDLVRFLQATGHPPRLLEFR